VREQAPDLNPVKINNPEDNIKHLKDNVQELKTEMISFTKEIRDMVQNRLAIQVIFGMLKEITHKAQITINIIKIDKPEIMVISIEIGVIVPIIISIGIETKIQ
jgi:hypothetical protein